MAMERTTALVLALLTAPWIGGAATAGHGGDGCVGLTEDAACSLVAVSATGDATCDPGSPCVAASGAGNASGCVAVSGTAQASSPCGYGDTTLAVSGCETGRMVGTNETCHDGRVEDPTGTVCLQKNGCPVTVRVTSDAQGELVAVSATGGARCSLVGCVAASGTGPAQAPLGSAVSGTGDASALLVAASLDGNSSCTFAACVAAAGTGDATSDDGVSVTILGHATSERAAVSGAGPATCGFFSCLAASGTGSADGWAAVAGAGDASGCVAVSAAGEANASCRFNGQPLEASGCETGRSLGSDAACWDGPSTGQGGVVAQLLATHLPV